MPEYHLPTEAKFRLREVIKQNKKVDDAFLSLFEKRNILFIEDGTDLKGELSNNLDIDNQDENSHFTLNQS